MVRIFEKSGEEWARGEDAAGAVMHFAADERINGRTFCIVPRSMDPRGYYDLGDDDFREGEEVTKWQERCVRLMGHVQREMVMGVRKERL
ncbi:hypothetical protein PRZ48_002469 [Zasmidium cellare]|uniref:Uncharacterized protein n=1 Tax=Zasmidium cellare TaxID=395010 RepID=A0ABR0F4V7_ZASCE|nr:hypothetical protein PRZ48_002469 [Zasmidium cellare]